MERLDKIGKLNRSIWVYANFTDVELQGGTIVEILDQYLDHGHWSDGDPYHVESPFPAYVIHYNGVTYDSVHTKVVNVID